jgi:hypothetical protein
MPVQKNKLARQGNAASLFLWDIKHSDGLLLNQILCYISALYIYATQAGEHL